MEKTKRKRTQDIFPTFSTDELDKIMYPRRSCIPLPLPPPLPTPRFLERFKYSDGSEAPPNQLNKNKHTLFLDIDATLLYCIKSHENPPWDLDAGIWGRGSHLYFSPRPDLVPFLQEVTELFEVVFFTGANEGYGMKVVQIFEEHLKTEKRSLLYTPEGMLHSLKLKEKQYTFPELCAHLSSDVIKDRKDALTPANYYVMGFHSTCGWTDRDQRMKFLCATGRPLHKMLIVDDNCWKSKLEPRNCISIPPFLMERGWQNDRELLKLMPLLRAVAAAPDVQKELDHWRADGYECHDDLKKNIIPIFDSTKSVPQPPSDNAWIGEVTSTRREKPIPPMQFDFGGDPMEWLVNTLRDGGINQRTDILPAACDKVPFSLPGDQ